MAAKKTRKLVKTPKKKALGRAKPARGAASARKKDVTKLKKKLRTPTAKKAAARVVTKKKVRPEKAKAAVAKTKKIVTRPEKKQPQDVVTKKLKKKKLIQKTERPVEKGELRKKKKKKLDEGIKLKKQARIERDEARAARAEKAERILRKKLAKERKLAARAAEEAPVKKRVAVVEEERPKKKKKKKKLLGEQPSIEVKPTKKVEAEEAPVKTKLKLKKKKKKLLAEAREAEPTPEIVKKKTKIAEKVSEKAPEKAQEKAPEKAPEKPSEKVKTKTKDAAAEKPEKLVKKPSEGKTEVKAEGKAEGKERTEAPSEKAKVRDGEKVKVRDGEKQPKLEEKKKVEGKPSEKGAPVKVKSTEGGKVVSAEKGEKKAGKSDKPAESKPRPKEEKSKAEPRVTAVREPAPRVAPIALPLLAPARKPTIEERSEVIEKRLESQSEEFRRAYTDRFDMSWIFHDSALEGVVYTFEELRSGLGSYASHYGDTGMQPTYDDIRKHKEAIEFVRDYAKKKLPITIDVIRKIYLILHPEEGDIKTVKYRKDIPQHRLYFHEYAPPDKIPYKVRQIVDWLNDPETRKTRNALRIAARAHYDLLRVYPFQTDSGKVARLFMNLLLMRSGLPPSIIHSTERQRYYEALKGQATTVLQMVQEAVENALSSVEKLLDEYETRKRAFVS